MTERSAWTHTLCDACWALLNPYVEPKRVLLRLDGDGDDICCQCGRRGCHGVYVREDPRSFACKGSHAA